MKTKSFLIALIMLSSVVLISGCTQDDSTDSGISADTPAIASSNLASCLSTIDETKLPASLGGYIGTPIEVTQPFSWSSNGAKVDMPAHGYMNNYAKETKIVSAAIMKIEGTSDYNQIVSDMQAIESQDDKGIIKKVDVEGATASVFDYSEQSSVIWYITAGDNIWVQIGFTGMDFEESQAWVNTWTSTIC